MIRNNPLQRSTEIVPVDVVIPHGGGGGDHEYDAVVEEERVEYLEETPDQDEDGVCLVLLFDFLWGFRVALVEGDCDETGQPEDLE